MSGILHVKGAPLPHATTVAITPLIPDEHSIEVKASTAYWLLYLHGPNGGRVYSGPLRVSRGLPLEEACRFALRRWFPDVVVTTDGAGWVKSIEDVA